MSLYVLGTLVLLLLINVIMSYRNRLQAQRHKTEMAATIAAALADHVQHRQQLDADLAQLGDKHRAETIIERSQRAARADFAADWDGLPNYPSRAAADDAAAVAHPASFADD